MTESVVFGWQTAAAVEENQKQLASPHPGVLHFENCLCAHIIFMPCAIY